MKKDDLLKAVDWTEKNLGEPLEIDGDFWLTVKLKESGFENEQELIALKGGARRTALDHLLKFENKDATETEKKSYLKHVIADDFVIPARLGSKIRVLIKLNIEKFYEIFQRDRETKTGQEILDADLKQLKISLSQLDATSKRIAERLREFEKGIQSYIGRISGFNLKQAIREVNQFPHDVRDLLRFNDISVPERLFSYGVSGTDILTFNINPLFQVEDIAYQERFSQEPVALHKGLDVFYGRAGLSPTSLSLYFEILKNTDDFLSKHRNFFEFVLAFVYPPPIISPAAEAIEKKFKKTADDIISGIGSSEQREGFKTVLDEATGRGLLQTDAKLDIRNRRAGETDFVGDNIVFDFDVVGPRMLTIEEIYDEFLNVIDLEQILDILLDCLPSFSFNIDFSLPTISLPKLPTFDFMLFIRLNLEDLLLMLLRELLEYLIGLLLDAIRKFCEDGDAPTPTSSPISAPSLNDTVRAAAPGGPEDTYSDLISPDVGDMLRDFLDELVLRLTPSQLCSLLSGFPSKMTLEIFWDLLEEEKFKDLQEHFKTDQDVINFFGAIAGILGSARLNQLCSSSDVPIDSPCDVDEAIRNVQKMIFDLKRQRGENIPDEFIEEQLNKTKEIQASIVDAINSLDKNVFDSFKGDLMDQIRGSKPFQDSASDIKMAIDPLIDGIFDPPGDRCIEVVKDFIPNLRKQEEIYKSGDEAGSLILNLKEKFYPFGGLPNNGQLFMRLAQDVPSRSPFLFANQAAPAFWGQFEQRIQQNSDLFRDFISKDPKKNTRDSQLGASLGSISEGSTSLEVSLLENVARMLIRVRILEEGLLRLPILSFISDLDYSSGILFLELSEFKPEFQKMFNKTHAEFAQDVLDEDFVSGRDLLASMIQPQMNMDSFRTSFASPEIADEQEFTSAMMQLSNYSATEMKQTFSISGDGAKGLTFFFSDLKEQIIQTLRGVRKSMEGI